jgi:hypothetical protein
MQRKNVTLSLDKNIYEQYKEYCEKNAIALSKSIEVFMGKKIRSK